MTYLWHTTLNTGRSRRSEIEEVAPAVRSTLRLVLAEAVAAPGQRAQIVPGPPGISIEAHPAGAHLLATVWDDASDLPLVTLAVAPRPRGAGRLWEALHKAGRDLASSVADVPRAPWCGVVVHPSIMVRPDALGWAGDMERCIAWTWMEMSHVGG